MPKPSLLQAPNHLRTAVMDPSGRAPRVAQPFALVLEVLEEEGFGFAYSAQPCRRSFCHKTCIPPLTTALHPAAITPGQAVAAC